MNVDGVTYVACGALVILFRHIMRKRMAVEAQAVRWRVGGDHGRLDGSHEEVLDVALMREDLESRVVGRLHTR